MRRAAAVLALAGALASAPAALAADQTVQAVEGAAETDNRWSPAVVTVRSGEKVTWTFTGTGRPHNVAAETPHGTFRTGFAVGQPPASVTYDTPGVYDFVCELHPESMSGTVTVTDAAGNPPPPPPPPPPGQQPFPNDAGAPPVLEIVDESPPRLTRVRVSRRGSGARVRFSVSEPARVTVRVKRGRRTVRTKSATTRRAGRHRLLVRGLRPARYRVEVLARDPAGNRSRVRRVRLTLR